MTGKEKTIRLRVTLPMRQQLDSLANARHESISIVVREAIVFYLNAREMIGLPDKSPLPELDQVLKITEAEHASQFNESLKSAKGLRKITYH